MALRNSVVMGKPEAEPITESIGMTYYEVLDKAQQVKVVYVFGVNDKNTALLMKFSKFRIADDVPSMFIKDLYGFKAF